MALVAAFLAGASAQTISVDWDGATKTQPRLTELEEEFERPCLALPPANFDWDRLEGAVLGALIADSLALRDHYEYDIERTLPRGISYDFADPGRENLTPGWGTGPACFHPNRQAGQQTDYGENVQWTLRFATAMSLTNGWPTSGVDDARFGEFWLEEMRHHDG